MLIFRRRRREGPQRMALPPFTSEGALPPGDYPLTFHELEGSFLVHGTGVQSPAWDAEWRRFLVSNLETLVEQLWQIGVTRIFANGSFVEEKDHPNDIDGYFECELQHFVSGRLERDLNALDPSHIWTWDASSRRPDHNATKRQLPMWHRYRVELYPHFGNLSGIRDAFGNDLTFPAAFRASRRANRPKGIVQIVR
jgi:hypothetical protein